MEDYREKYEMALEGIQEILSSGEDSIEMSRLELRLRGIFPELHESESEDERIRKRIYNYINVTLDDNESAEKEKWLAWLEKQGEQKSSYTTIVETGNGGINAFITREFPTDGEQKPVDKVEPKFKVGDVMRTLQETDGNVTSGLPVVVFVGNEYYHCTNELIAIKDQDDYEYPPMNRMQEPIDKVEPKFKIYDWIVHDMSDGRKVMRRIIGMTNEHYILDGEGFNTFYFNDIENDYHLWTIDDASDGDVLVCEDDKMPFIFKGLLDHYHPNYPVAYCGIDNENEFIVCNGDSWWDDCKIEPATKEQRNTLFAKMKEAGYEWDANKKKMKKNE